MTLTEYTELLGQARSLIESGLHESAQVLATFLLSSLQHSKSILALEIKIDAHIILGRTSMETLEYARAKAYFLKAIKTMEKTSKGTETLWGVKLAYGEACWALDDVHDAEKMLQSVPELSRTDKIWALLAKLYERMENSKLAIYCYRVLLDKNPSAIHVIERLYELGATKKEVSSVLKLNPGAPWVLDLVDSLESRQQYNFGEELVVLKNLESVFHNNSYLLTRMADCHSNLSQPLESLRIFKKIQMNDAENPRAMDQFASQLTTSANANSLKRLGHYAKERWIARPEAWLISAQKSRASEDFTKAIRSIDKALELDLTYAPAHILKGAVCLEQDQPNEAVSHFRKALSLTQDLRAYEGLVKSYLTLEQPKEAFSVASGLFKRAPVPRTMTLMATAVSHLPGRQAEAKSLLRSVLSVTPNCLEAVLSLVGILTKEGQLDEAIELLTGQLNHQQHEDFIYTQIGDLCADAKSFDKARAFYETALSIHPDSVKAQQGMSRLERLINGGDEEEEEQEEDEEEPEEEEVLEESMTEESMDEDM